MNIIGIWCVLFVLFVFMKKTLGCRPTKHHRQELYCNSPYVFEAKVKGLDDGGDEMYDFKYRINVVKSYREQLSKNFDGLLTGNGYFMACGPQILEKNSSYLIFAYNYYGQLRISEFISMKDMNHPEIELLSKYTCACKIKLSHKDRESRSPKFNMTRVDPNVCEIPTKISDSSFKLGYCYKTSDGICKWNVSDDR